MSEGSSRRLRSAPLLVLICAFVCMAFAPAVAGAATGGNLAGSVINATTSAPAEGIEVCLFQIGGEGFAGCEYTDGGGDYEFTELPAGEYEAVFSGRGWAQLTESGLQIPEGETTVLVTPLVKRGSIKGTVTEAGTSTELEGIEVCATQIGGEGGGCEATGPGGTYVIEGLIEGEYEVSFSGSGWAQRFYDGVLPFNPPTPVMVVESEATGGIDAELERNGSIEGTVTVAGGGPIAAGLVCANSKTEYYNACAFTDSNGEYAITELPPGEFEIEFSGQVCDSSSGCEREECEYQVSCSRPYIPQVYIEQAVLNVGGATLVPVIADEATEDIDAALHPGGKIEGTVTLAALEGTALEGIEVCAGPEELELRGECAKTDANGEYSIEGLDTGAYEVQVSGQLCPENGCPPEYVTRVLNGISVTAPDVTTGIDASLAETEPTKPAFTASPQLSGNTSVGSTLTCTEGTWSNHPTDLAYSWQRGGATISGQGGSTYRVTSEDAGASLTCAVTITNGAGSASATSNALAIPAATAVTTTPATSAPASTPPPAPGVASAASPATATKKVVKVKLKCNGQSSCKGTLKLTYKKVAFGKGTSFSIAKGKTKTITVKLTSKGIAYLKEAGKKALKVKLGGSGVKARTLTVKPPA